MHAGECLSPFGWDAIDTNVLPELMYQNSSADFSGGNDQLEGVAGFSAPDISFHGSLGVQTGGLLSQEAQNRGIVITRQFSQSSAVVSSSSATASAQQNFSGGVAQQGGVCEFFGGEIVADHSRQSTLTSHSGHAQGVSQSSVGYNNDYSYVQSDSQSSFASFSSAGVDQSNATYVCNSGLRKKALSAGRWKPAC